MAAPSTPSTSPKQRPPRPFPHRTSDSPQPRRSFDQPTRPILIPPRDVQEKEISGSSASSGSSSSSATIFTRCSPSTTCSPRTSLSMCITNVDDETTPPPSAQLSSSPSHISADDLMILARQRAFTTKDSPTLPMPVAAFRHSPDEIRPRAISSPLSVSPNGSKAKLTGLPGSGLKKSFAHSPPPRPRVVPKLSFSETNLSVTLSPQATTPDRSSSLHSFSPPPRPQKPLLPTLPIPSSPVSSVSPQNSPVGSPHRGIPGGSLYHVPRPGGYYNFFPFFK